jgi:tight adherence protein B
MSGRVRLIAVAAAAALVAAAPAAAGVELSGVDTSSYPTIHATVVSSAGPKAVPVITENGQRVVGLDAENLSSAKAVVLAVDNSQSMQGRPLSDAVAAARSFVAAKPPADAIAVIEFGRHPTELSGLSTATSDSDTALAGITTAGESGTALYDGIDLASSILKASSVPGRVLIVLTDGRDVSSRDSLAAAVAAAHDGNVSIYPIGIEGAGFDPAPLQELARATGGRYYGAASTGALARVYSTIAATLGHTWRVTYVTSARPGDHITVGATVPGAGSATSSAVVTKAAGDVTGAAAPSNLLPTSAYGSAGPALVGLIAGVLVVAAFLLLLGARRGSWLRSRLAPHLGAATTRSRRRSDRTSLRTMILGATERAFGRLRQWKSVQQMLDRGETPLTAAELFYVVAGAAFLAGLLGAAIGGSLIVTLMAMAIGGAAPFFFVWRRMKRRLTAFEDQLPDMLITIAASLKAGHSFKQGLQAVVDEGQPPASVEFKRVLTETGLGRPMDDALGDMVERVSSKNFEFAITAVTIQRQVGGSLANLFDLVADTVRQRQQFARKVRSLTAMGRMSAYTLLGLPFFLIIAISFLNAGYLHPLFHTSAGHMMLVLGLVMMAIGSAIVKKIVSFKG